MNIGLKILHLLGAHKLGSSLRVPWDKLDLSDPEKPRLLCSVDELEKIEEQPKGGEREQPD